MPLPHLRSTLTIFGIALVLGSPVLAQDDPLAPGGDVFGQPRAAGQPGGGVGFGGPGGDVFGQPPGGGAGGGGTATTREELQQQLDEIRNEAKSLADQKDWEGAIAQYNQALQLSRQDVDSFLGLADIYRELRFQDLETTNLRSAASALAAERKPTGDVYFRLGQLYAKQTQYRQAIEFFTACLRENPTNPTFIYEYGLAQANQGYNSTYGAAARESLQTAIESFTQAIRLKQDYADAYFERGNALLRLNNLDDSIDDLEKAATLAPDRMEIVGRVGFARLQRAGAETLRQDGKQLQINQDYQRAIDTLSAFLAVAKAESKKSDPPEVRGQETKDDRNKIPKENAFVARAMASIGLADEQADDSAELYSKAIEDCSAALKIDPTLTLALLQRGIAQRMRGMFDEAVESFTDAIQSDARDQQSVASAMLRRGIVRFHRGEMALATTDFETLYGATRDPHAGFWLGLTQAQEGKHAEAILSYNRVLQDQPDYVIAYLNRGISQLKVGRYARAVEDFNQVLLHDRQHPQANSYRALALNQLSRK